MTKFPSLFEIAGLIVFSAMAAMLLAEYGFGQHDWSAYWRATHLFFAGEDPYSLVAHEQFAAKHLETHSPNLQIWNPPLLFPLLLPIAIWSFETSITVLHFVTIFLSALMAWLCFDFISPRPLRWFSALCIFIFPPMLMNVLIGQLGVIIAFGVFMGVYLLLKRRDFLSGFFFLLASPKPHSWFLIAALVGVIVVSQRRWKVIAGMLTGLLPLLYCCLYVNPDIFSLWIGMDNNPLPWASVSGVTPLRLWLSSAGYSNDWPLLLIPGAALMLVLFLSIYRGTHWSTEEGIVGVITLSMLVAPFGWGFDQMLLLCPFIFSIAHGVQERDRGVGFRISCGLAPLLGFVYLGCLSHVEVYWFFLYAPALYLIWRFTKWQREKRASLS
ncbi:MAG: glycosyltransferase family 87 protein [Bdellovibrionota bacterium]